jgi:hypothetical protein
MIEAMKQALEALESCTPQDTSTGHVIHAWHDEELVNKSITSLRQAISELEQRSIAELESQEPVVTKNEKGLTLHIGWNDLPVGSKLYTTPTQRTWVGLDWLPEHKCGLHLSHNEHRDVYETIEQFYNAEDFISTEEWRKAVAEDSVWVLHWYPNTPIGFNRIAASTLEAIEAKLKEKNT